MLAVTYKYRIDPDASCSCPVDRGSWVQESILPADAPFPVD
ncbi:hypothetical protein CYB_2917 [Synechococcus sp. JA-2-3B'a(2-13)]|nr:hypothetical protein CYB_0711 [Synechococcus sp. JA-2-3B'a(2-13)]ABD03836.1 hypothetical protein CYB_2917 [Synechococcus sp. JA-2-3B'a(2-13)]